MDGNNKTLAPLDEAFISKLVEEFTASDYAPVDGLDSTDGFLPTNASKLIVSRLKTALEQGMGLALVHGPAGVGKTMGVKVFAERYAGDRRAMYIRAHPDFAPSALLDELAIGLRMTRVSKFRMLINMVKEGLERIPSVVIVDEAQLCPRATLETIKFLTDQTGALFVLVTTDEFVDDVRRWRDIESRIGIVAGIGSLGEAEHLTLYSDSGFTTPALKAIHKLAGGVMRDINRLVVQVDKFIALNAARGLDRASITREHIIGVAKKVNLVGKGKL